MKIGSTSNQAFTGKLQVVYRTLINDNRNIPPKIVERTFVTTFAQDEELIKRLATFNPENVPNLRSRIQEGFFEKIRSAIRDITGIDLEHISIKDNEYNLATVGEKNLHINGVQQIIISDGGLFERTQSGYNNAMEMKYSIA